MAVEFNRNTRRLGIYSASIVIILLIAYAITLSVGLMSLESPDDQIDNPLFSILEILIILLMPAMVTLMAVVHAWAPIQKRTFSLIAFMFMGLLAALTMSLHFVILSISRHPALADLSWLPLFLSFRWPSMAYSLDILGWDVLFALSMLFSSIVFGGNQLARWIRGLMIASGVLSFAGLIGVFVDNMSIRNIGIIGYVPVFIAITVLLFMLFYRTRLEE